MKKDILHLSPIFDFIINAIVILSCCCCCGAAPCVTSLVSLSRGPREDEDWVLGPFLYSLFIVVFWAP